MKKRISTILAVVLTIALLASSFVMLGVHAEDPATETLTIGTTDYEIYTDKKFAAYDSIAAAIEGLTAATSDYKNAPEVSFAGKSWLVESTGLWSTELIAPKYISTSADYNQLCFYTSEPVYARKSIVLYDGKIMANAAHGWQSVGDMQIKPIYFRFTATEAGNVVLYDTVGTVSAPAKNTTPFWAWLGNTNDGGEWATFTIYKNDTIIWPKNNQDNKLEVGGDSIDFPDLGAIAVKAGDIISVEVSAYGDRTGIYINPAIAYAKVDANQGGSSEPVETEEITIGENTYTIEKNSKYNAYDTLKAATSSLDVNAYPAVNFSSSVWQVKTARWNNAYDANLYYGPAPYSGNPSFMVGNSAGHWATQQNSVNVALDSNEYLAVSPFVKDDGTASAIIDLDFKAPKNGKVLIYDVLGAVKAPAANNISPYWAWLSGHNNKVEVSVLKNGVKIWPTDTTTDNFISDVGDSVVIPDLGAIEVAKGDRVTLRLQEVNNKSTEKLPSRDVVYTDIEVAYIYEETTGGGEGESEVPTTEKVTIGKNTYDVLVAEKYNARDTFANLTASLDASKVTQIDMSKSVWQMQSAIWNSAYSKTYNYGTGNAGSGIAYPVIVAGSSTSPITNLTSHWSTANYKVSLAIGAENLYVSPWFDDKTSSPFIDVNFVAPKSGKVVIYDVLGTITTPGQDEAPFWCWKGTTSNNEVEITIWKNDVKIWPTSNKTDNKITVYADGVEFPDLGEIKVNRGDVLSVRFAELGVANNANRDVVKTDLEVAYTVVTGASQTDANFGTEVMVLVSVIAVLGAVVIAAGIVSKKRAQN